MKKFVSWNVNGIRAICKKNFLEWFLTQDADIVCVQEIKALEEQFSKELEVLKENYFCYVSSAERKGYSGVAVWTKEKPLKVYYGWGETEFDSEGRVVRLDFKDYIFFGVYFPNGGASPERFEYKMRFYDVFRSLINTLQKKKPVIFCGDVNTAHKAIDLARPKANEGNSGFLPEERAWIDMIIADGFYDSFRLQCAHPDNYSWWDYKTRARDRNVGWRIDYFFISEALVTCVVEATIQTDTFGSDHCPVVLTMAL